MNSSSLINTNPTYSKETSSQQSNLTVFKRTYTAILTLLFCTYVLFIQYTCSIYFIPSVFFLSPNRPQQYEQFIMQHLYHGESVDVYLLELWNLTVLFSRKSDHSLALHLWWDLSDKVKQFLYASSQMDVLAFN